MDAIRAHFLAEGVAEQQTVAILPIGARNSKDRIPSISGPEDLVSRGVARENIRTLECTGKNCALIHIFSDEIRINLSTMIDHWNVELPREIAVMPIPSENRYVSQ